MGELIQIQIPSYSGQLFRPVLDRWALKKINLSLFWTAFKKYPRAVLDREAFKIRVLTWRCPGQGIILKRLPSRCPEQINFDSALSWTAKHLKSVFTPQCPWQESIVTHYTSVLTLRCPRQENITKSWFRAVLARAELISDSVSTGTTRSLLYRILNVHA